MPPRKPRAAPGVERKRIREIAPCVSPFLETPRVISEPREAAGALHAFIGGRASECFVVLYLSVRNQAVGYLLLTEGSAVGVSVHPMAIFQEALLVNAAGFITAHQHPSGDVTPSDQDFALWERLRENAQLMGMACVDNMVLGPDRFFSEGLRGIAAYYPR